MTMQWIHTAWMSVAFLAVFGCAEFLFHKAHVRAELTRKFVHVLSGMLTLLFPVFFTHAGFVLLLCTSFALILVVSQKSGHLQSIHAVGRRTQGSVLFTVAVFVAFVYFQTQQHVLYFFLPIGIMAVCDPLAALVGKKTNWVVLRLPGGSKTLGGSVAFFLSAAFVTVLLLALFGAFACGQLLWCAGLALTTALAELVSQRGTDNVFIPISAMIYMCLIPLTV